MASRIDPRLQYPPSSHYPPPSQAPHQSSPYPYHTHHSTPPDPSAPRLPRITPGPPGAQTPLRPSAPPPPPPPSQQHPHNHQHQHHQPYYSSHAHPSPPQRPYSPYQHHGDDSPMDGSYQDPNDPKRARACESCRGLKVRCDRDPNTKDQPCARCAKAKRPCIVTEPSRKRQKKTDSRVAELERKIERLSALLPAHVQDLESPSRPEANDDDDDPSEPAMSPDSTKHVKKMRTTASPGRDSAREHPASSDPREFTAATRERKPSGPVEPTEKKFRPPHATASEGCGPSEPFDVEAPEPVSAFVSRRVAEIVDEATAARIFEHYVADMAVHMPAIMFPPGTRADHVRKTKPLLFLSILVASSVGMAPSSMQLELHALLLSTLADSVIGNVEKRLDVVQALLVATIWYRPPRRYEQMNFYQLAHSAAVMGIDLGLGKRTLPARSQPSAPLHSRAGSKQSLPVPDSLEARRTWLGCYFQCATISMCLRRPPLIRWTKYLEESVELLETSREAFDSDRLLCQHVKLQHLNEEIGQRLSMDDPAAAINITDPHTQDAIRGFEGALGDWRKAAQNTIWNTQLDISEKVTSLYMHETALHIGHNVDDFRAPFTEESIRSNAGQGLQLSPAHSKALLDCLKAVHGIFDIFFSFELAVVRSLPIFFFVRVGYAVVVLVRLHFAVMAPDSEISKLISPEDVAVEAYLGKLLSIFQAVHDQESFRPAVKFLIIVKRLYSWFQETKNGGTSGGTSGAKEDGPGASKTAGVKRDRNGLQAQQLGQLDLRASTPLDLLSQVATANAGTEAELAANRSQSRGQTQAKTPGAPAGNSDSVWYGSVPAAAGQLATPGAGEFGVGIDFTSAIDYTLDGVMNETADLSWLFSPDYSGFEAGKNMW